MFATLPPRPDPQTGEPRPPRAPVEASHDEGFPDSSRRPPPTKLPPGEEPMLEWYVQSHKVTLASVAVVVVLVFLFGASGFFTSDDLSWLTSPGWVLFVFGLPLLLAAVLYWTSKREFIAAGAEWVAHQTGWVRVYELTEIKTRADVAVLKLCLTDTAGRKMDPTLSTLQHNRDLWNLVYNGILHSIRDREVETDHTARLILQLHGPLIVRDVVQGRYRDDDSVTVGKRSRRGRRFRRGRRQP